MGPVPFIALELLERGPPMLDDYRVPAHRLPDQLPAGTEAVAQLAELALLAIRLFFAFTSRGEMRRCSFSVRLLIQIQMLNDSTVTLSIIEYEFKRSKTIPFSKCSKADKSNREEKGNWRNRKSWDRSMGEGRRSLRC